MTAVMLAYMRWLVSNSAGFQHLVSNLKHKASVHATKTQHNVFVIFNDLSYTSLVERKVGHV
ncbi:MAG: hypothetical protein ACI9CE_002142 [Flavobacterium sp.]|jgi:hypothetical protein